MLKHIQLIICFVFIFNLPVSFAKIWRVNNNAGITADFTTLQAAHNGASPGDTIHVEGSPTNYGSLNCSKNLVIIGPGYFLEENINSQAFTQTAKITIVNFYAGSAGSVIMGLDFQGYYVNIFSNDIVIRRNRFSIQNSTAPDYYTGSINLYYQSNNSSIPVSNIVISQNFGVTITVSTAASTGILITNNYIAYQAVSGDQTANKALSLSANTIAVIQNNIFRRGKIEAYNCNFANNIMVAGSFEGLGNLVSNNISNGKQFGSLNGNQPDVDMSDVFVGPGAGVSSDGQWKLKAGSPAIGAGYDSTPQNPVDAGMYGGQTSYVLAGLPPVPAIYSFENQPIGTSTDPINVTIRVKSIRN